jgi:hypothetical protein
VKYPDVQEHLQAPGPPLVEGLLLLVIPTLLQVAEVLLARAPELQEAEQP